MILFYVILQIDNPPPAAFTLKLYSHRNLIVSPFIKFIYAFKEKQSS